MVDLDEEFGNIESKEDPLWRGLEGDERKELMLNIFTNRDWYEEAGSPVFEGGSANPLFQEVSDRTGAPVSEIRRYYAAWMKSQGFNREDYARPSQTNHPQEPTETTTQSPSRMSMRDFMVKDEPDEFTPPQQQQPSGNSEMWAMMTFLMSQQKMAMQQQQFQSMMQMEQKRDDDGRRREDRREQSARDQQFMNQNMTLLKETFKRSKDDGFFDADTKSIMKEKFVEQLMGGGDDSWKDLIKDVAGSDTLKAAVGGIGTALATRRPPMPAGYDQPNYNPYAPQNVPTEAQTLSSEEPATEEVLDGVFFEGPPQQPEPEELPKEYNRDQYSQLIFTSFVQMDPTAQDPLVRKAIQEQVDIAVDMSMLELPEATPQNMIQNMSEKMLLVRNVRDIAQGLQQLRQQTPIDADPPPYLIEGAITQLRKDSPEFYKIFATHTYEELLVQIEPFRETGGVNWDYEFLLQPETGRVCRPLLDAITTDAQANGYPDILSN